jgi:hypothetical protein
MGMNMKISKWWSSVLLAVSCGGSDPVANDQDGTTGTPIGSSGEPACEEQPTVIVHLRTPEGHPVEGTISYTVDGEPGGTPTCMPGTCFIWDGAGQLILIEADDEGGVLMLSTTGGGASTCEAPSSTIELVFGECYDDGGPPTGDSSGTSSHASSSGSDGDPTSSDGTGTDGDGTGTTSDETSGSSSTGAESTDG